MCEYREGYFTIPDFQWGTVASKMKTNKQTNKIVVLPAKGHLLLGVQEKKKT